MTTQAPRTDIQPHPPGFHGETYDVAVIGAGPAGSVSAERIAAAGWRVVLIEKSQYPGKDAVCGGMIARKDAELFRIDPSIIEKNLLQANNYYPWGYKEIHFPESLKNLAVTVQRKHFDRHLAEKAVRSGAELRTQCHAYEVKRIQSGTMIVKFLENKQEKEIMARLVVFADGPVTLAHRCFHIGYEARPDDVAVSVVCDVQYPENPMTYFDTYYDPGIAMWGFGWGLPCKEYVNLGLCFLRSEIGRNRRLLLDRLDFMLKRYPPSLRLVQGRTLMQRRGALIPMRLARRIHDDSCLVVGDAAGFVGSFSGVGITYAMHSGLVAAETAIEALRMGDFSAAFLARYPRRWRRTRKYKVLWMMNMLKSVLMVIHRIDPHALNKIVFLSGIFRFRARDRHLRFIDVVRIVFYPILGNPNVKIVRTIPHDQGDSRGSIAKGG